jgi:hypothetical protein
MKDKHETRLNNAVALLERTNQHTDKVNFLDKIRLMSLMHHEALMVEAAQTFSRLQTENYHQADVRSDVSSVVANEDIRRDVSQQETVQQSISQEENSQEAVPQRTHNSKVYISDDDVPDEKESEIAQNFISLSKFTIEQMNIQDVTALKVKTTSDCFVVYAMADRPIMLNFEKYTSDDKKYKKLLEKTIAMQAHFFTKTAAEHSRKMVVHLVEKAEVQEVNAQVS